MAPLVLTQQVDSSTWQALGLVLTLVGLGISVVVWRRSGAGRAQALSDAPLVRMTSAYQSNDFFL